jgi:hypothetical protein
VKERPRLGLLILVGLCVLVAAAIGTFGQPRPVRTTLEMAPEGTTMVGHVLVPALLVSPIWQAYVGADEGMSRIERLCGFSPLAQLNDVDAYVVGTDDGPLDHLAFLARGDLDGARLAACVGQVVEEDGGSVREVRIEGLRAMASVHGEGRAAFLAPGVVVGGDETLVRELIHLDHGTAQPADDAALARLWAVVSGRREILLAMRVPDGWRDAIRHALESAPGLMPIAHADAVALGATVSHGGIGATLTVACRRSDDAHRLTEAVRNTIADALDQSLVRLSAAGVALRRIEIEARDGDLVATLDLDRHQLEEVVALVREQLDDLAGARRRIDQLRDTVIRDE